jgi:hypothetical protein
MARTTNTVVKKPREAKNSRSRRDCGNLRLYTFRNRLWETMTLNPPRIAATKIGRIQKLRWGQIIPTSILARRWMREGSPVPIFGSGLR